jgi:glycosyltransferase involved in cell wall biosynthesis
MACLCNEYISRIGLMIEKPLITVVMYYSDDLPYDTKAFSQILDSVCRQHYMPLELIIIDSRGTEAKLDFIDTIRVSADISVEHLPGSYRNRAAMVNAALKQAKGTHIVHIDNLASAVMPKHSAIDAFFFAMQRDNKVGMIYADYELVDEAGRVTEQHLLDYHAGRLRDNMDFGRLVMYCKDAVEAVGGLCEDYMVGELYDLRLKLSEHYGVRHISNKIQGSLYTVIASKKGHDVFDYLLSSKENQLELEHICTEHLKRIGAHLAPGANFHRVAYTPEEEEKFKECIASVVIPVNNRPEFIGTAIESVQNQTVKNVEVIVMVNGGEKDPTAEEVRRYMQGGDAYDADAPQVRLFVLDINNIGLCLNMGIAAARGKYYVQLDSDDRLKPDAIEKIIAEFEKDPTVGMVIGSYEVWQKSETTGEVTRKKEIPVVTHDEWTYENGRNNLLRINGAGAPRSAHIKLIKEMGWFGLNDERFSRNYGEDYDMVHRISEHYKIGRIFEPIYDVIRHAGGTDHSIDQATIDRNDEAKDWMRLKALQRRKVINRMLQQQQQEGKT